MDRPQRRRGSEFVVAGGGDPGSSKLPDAEVTAPGYNITVFTTRPDTLFGATYMVLAPEHPLVDRITTPEQSSRRSPLTKRRSRAKSDLERTELAKEKTGVFTGAFAINPVNGERIPIWIADYVLMGYGTGAIMAVPAHDERDLEFARKFDLPILDVVKPPGDADGHWFRRGWYRDQFPADRRPAHAGGERAHHRLAGRTRTWPAHDQLQTARLAFFPPALLGRAVPDRLARRTT